MKTIKTKSRKSKTVKLSGMKGCTVNFSGVIPADNEGSNGNYSESFAIIENLVLSQYVGRSVSINDFYQLSGSLGIPASSIKANFAKFVKKQLADKRIVQIETCLDDNLYVVV